MKYLISVIVESPSDEDTAAFTDLIADMPIYDGPVEVGFADYDYWNED